MDWEWRRCFVSREEEEVNSGWEKQQPPRQGLDPSCLFLVAWDVGMGLPPLYFLLSSLSKSPVRRASGGEHAYGQCSEFRESYHWVLALNRIRRLRTRGWNRQGREAGCQLWFSSFSQWAQPSVQLCQYPGPELVLFVSLCCLSDECQQEKSLMIGTFSPLQIFLINRKSNIRVYRSWYFFPQ